MNALEWMTDKEAAAYLKITPRLLKDRARRGLLPGHPIPGGDRCTIWRFLRPELDEAMTASSSVTKSAEAKYR